MALAGTLTIKERSAKVLARGVVYGLIPEARLGLYRANIAVRCREI
jgi:hypothetical protein